MNKEEFLKRLEELLSDISEEERADALAFYRSYFEDAGIGNEASILEELESPEKVAEVIKKDLGVSETADVETPEEDVRGEKMRHIQKKHLEMVKMPKHEWMIHI